MSAGLLFPAQYFKLTAYSGAPQAPEFSMNNTNDSTCREILHYFVTQDCLHALLSKYRLAEALGCITSFPFSVQAVFLLYF